MTLHAIAAYIKYRWVAKNLHGVHSPFAYNFSEKVLNDGKSVAIAEVLKPYAWLPKKYYRLLGKMFAYFNYSSIHCLTQDDEDEPGTYDVLVLKEDNPGHWVKLFNKYYPHVHNHSAIMIHGIYKTKRHTAKWAQLNKHPKVLLSIDLYGVGLLFFRKEFKEKQHFVLACEG